MPLTMQLSMLGLGPRIGGSADNPRATANVLIRNIDPTYDEDDITKKVIQFVAPTVNFTVPNPTGETAHTYTLLYLDSVLPEMISDVDAVAAVEWNLVKSTPLTRIDPATGQSRKPSETPDTQILGPEYSFDTSGGTKHITQSQFTRYAIKTGGGNFSAPNVKGAIGVSKDRVEGCDIVTGEFKWQLKVKGVPVTTNYMDTLVELTGTVNLSQWHGREPEELLFLGATGTYKAGDAWEVTYSFAQKKNRTNVEVVPGAITIPIVKGHDFLWAAYPDTVDTGFTVKIANRVYCEQVYERKDFDRLGI
jgi:hypothetical protein